MKKQIIGGLLAVSMVASMGTMSVEAAEKDNADISFLQALQRLQFP